MGNIGTDLMEYGLSFADAFDVLNSAMKKAMREWAESAANTGDNTTLANHAAKIITDAAQFLYAEYRQPEGWRGARFELAKQEDNFMYVLDKTKFRMMLNGENESYPVTGWHALRERFICHEQYIKDFSISVEPDPMKVYDFDGMNANSCIALVRVLDEASFFLSESSTAETEQLSLAIENYYSERREQREKKK